MRSRMLGAAIATVAIAVLAAALGAATAYGSPHDEVPGVHVALGDSLAVGTGATDEQRLGYVAHVVRLVRGVSHGEVDTLVNFAVGGETSGTFISDGQLAAALAAIEDPDTDTRLVTLDIGGDVLLPLLGQAPCAGDPAGVACQGIVAAQLAVFAGNFPAILGALQEALAADPGEERLLVMTYYNPFSGTGAAFEGPVDAVLLGADGTIDCAANAVDPAKIGLNDLISCIASAAEATVVDVYPAFEGRAALLTHIAAGDVHPNNFGHWVIAAEHIRALR